MVTATLSPVVWSVPAATDRLTAVVPPEAVRDGDDAELAEYVGIVGGAEAAVAVRAVAAEAAGGQTFGPEKGDEAARDHLVQIAVPGVVVVLVLLEVDAAVDGGLGRRGGEDPAEGAGAGQGGEAVGEREGEVGGGVGGVSERLDESGVCPGKAAQDFGERQVELNYEVCAEKKGGVGEGTPARLGKEEDFV